MECKISQQKNMIERYLSGALSPEEKEGAEEHLFNCEVCFEEIQLREEMSKLVKEERQILFADYLQTQQAEVKKGVYSPGFGEMLVNLFSNKQRKWALATVVLAVVAVAIFIIINPVPHSPIAQLYETEPFPFVKPSIRGANSGQKLFFESMEYYELQDFKMVAEKLENALETNPELKDAYFYLGVSYYLQNDLDKALENLIIDTENNPNAEKGHWFLGHTYLKKNAMGKALQQFEIVAELQQKIYSQRAQELNAEIAAPESKQR